MAKIKLPKNLRDPEKLGEGALSGAIKMLGHWWSLPVASGFLALISQWDYQRDKERIKNDYEVEIAARTGKAPHELNVQDMERVAKTNPIIAEARHRSRRHRNLSIGVTVFSAVTAVIVGTLMGPGLPLLAMGATFLGFLGLETVTEKVGEHALGINEPSLGSVHRQPELQSKLSVSSQVRMLQQRQARRQPISQLQVMTVFASANRRLDAQIQSYFGMPFAKLSNSAQRQVLEQFGAQYNIAGITEDLNNRHVRAQELAFKAYGQSSGVKRFESPKIEAMQKQIDDLTTRINATPDSPEQGKLAFTNSSVAMGSPDMSAVPLKQAETSSTADTDQGKWAQYINDRQRLNAAAQRA